RPPAGGQAARVNDAGVIARTYRRFADVECRGYSDAYFHLALAVAGDDEVMAFLAGLPVVQPNLIFAAIQLLTGPHAMPATAPELRAFLGKRGDEVGRVMRSRRTQTNEVGRCAALLPALPGASGPRRGRRQCRPLPAAGSIPLRARFGADRRR